MGDFELIGFPYAIVVGKKLDEDMVEFVCRKSGEKIDVKLENVLEVTKKLQQIDMTLHRAINL